MDFDKLKLKCECGGTMEKVMTEWNGFKLRGWKCRKCKEEILHPVDTQRALEIVRARKKNLLVVKLRRVGKSNVVTIPQPIIEAEKLREGQKLEWRIDGKDLILRQQA
ncbi:AbrB/MazE/SpoVT family DNA-binding domain-containing protein [Candidatus Woesearchaeota archaeon]|nr:AbrB/MazE/SpoVT family DNA-binding domain-containing protein [Candidatus Woesearchaeota archaeon]